MFVCCLMDESSDVEFMDNHRCDDPRSPILCNKIEPTPEYTVFEQDPCHLVKPLLYDADLYGIILRHMRHSLSFTPPPTSSSSSSNHSYCYAVKSGFLGYVPSKPLLSSPMEGGYGGGLVPAVGQC
ncbi:Uncharacterized protein TCM_037654 [Theobroma cacao]|uniref:Uncharacterized protein n=1 Tax=Theobroma cacao TaxID=3641 RepID=A0A061GMR0_THECC|nr:Uncharacterized protein TCM_037654 [Theobroma cacao]